MLFRRNEEKRPCAPFVVEQCEGRALQAFLDLGESASYLIYGRTSPTNVLIDNKALFPFRERKQLIEESILGAMWLMGPDLDLKPVVGVQEH